MRIFLVESRSQRRLDLMRDLGSRGIDCEGAADVSEALGRLRQRPCDVALVGIADGRDDERQLGIQLALTIRQVHSGLLLVYAPPNWGAVSEALRSGIDDVLRAPLAPDDMDEFVARILSSHRLFSRQGSHHRVVQVAEMELDLTEATITVFGRRLDLTPEQVSILLALAQRPGTILSKQDLSLALGKRLQRSSRAVPQAVLRLRERLGPSGRLIETVRGMGYRLAINMDAPV